MYQKWWENLSLCVSWGPSLPLSSLWGRWTVGVKDASISGPINYANSVVPVEQTGSFATINLTCSGSTNLGLLANISERECVCVLTEDEGMLYTAANSLRPLGFSTFPPSLAPGNVYLLEHTKKDNATVPVEKRGCIHARLSRCD